MTRIPHALARGALLTVCAALAGPALAQAPYPSEKPIRLIVPYAPGGSTSALGQFLAPALSKALGQSVFVDHRPGANTTIGTLAAAKSAPDGYTLLLAASSLVVVPLMSNAPYDAIKDFAPIATLAKTEFVVVVHPSVPARTLGEFLALAKSKPDQISYGSAGNGSGVHLVAEQVAQAANVKFKHVPYKGSGPMINDLVGGQLHASFQTPAVAVPFINSGRLRALAISGNEPSPNLPKVPIFSEAGLPNLQASNWFGVLAPARTAPDIVARNIAALNTVSRQPDFREKLLNLGFVPHFMAGDRFEADLRAENTRMAAVINATKITMD